MVMFFFFLYIYIYSGCNTQRSQGEVHGQNNSYCPEVILVFR